MAQFNAGARSRIPSRDWELVVSAPGPTLSQVVVSREQEAEIRKEKEK
jgi:hypothetical protein